MKYANTLIIRLTAKHCLPLSSKKAFPVLGRLFVCKNIAVNYSETFFLEAMTATPRAATRSTASATKGVESPVLVVPVLAVLLLLLVSLFSSFLLEELLSPESSFKVFLSSATFSSVA